MLAANFSRSSRGSILPSRSWIRASGVRRSCPIASSMPFLSLRLSQIRARIRLKDCAASRISRLPRSSSGRAASGLRPKRSASCARRSIGLVAQRISMMTMRENINDSRRTNILCRHIRRSSVMESGCVSSSQPPSSILIITWSIGNIYPAYSGRAASGDSGQSIRARTSGGAAPAASTASETALFILTDL